MKDHDDLDREIKEEINRKYDNEQTEIDYGEVSRSRHLILGTTALILALLFLLSVTGRFLYVLGGPAFTFLQESWDLADDPVVRGSRDAVARLYADGVPGIPGGQRRGTGFNIEPDGLVVTNRHLVEDAAMVRVSFPGRGTYTAEEWHVSEEVDLAIVELEADNLPVVPLSERRPDPGDQLLVIGNPMQFARIANKGELIGYSEHPHERDLSYLVVEAAIYPGSSGSPLFNEQGKVVGVVFATLRDRDLGQVRGLAVDVREIEILRMDISIVLEGKIFTGSAPGPD
ncbi:MAG: serine protease [Bacillota bacterium]